MSELVISLNLPLMGISLAAGLLLGVLYLLGLWWTVRQVTATGNRGLLVISFVVRAALLLAGLWFLAGFGPQSLIAALTGFNAVKQCRGIHKGFRRDFYIMFCDILIQHGAGLVQIQLFIVADGNFQHGGTSVLRSL